MWVRASLFRRFTDTNVHGTGFISLYRKLGAAIVAERRVYLHIYSKNLPVYNQV